MTCTIVLWSEANENKSVIGAKLCIARNGPRTPFFACGIRCNFGGGDAATVAIPPHGDDDNNICDGKLLQYCITVLYSI